ncbi:uncharacterized protein LOC134840320 [Symsagittifera roscoffensis]|uniref:uncharacterized protein LOC134840320 n=1 Tax=Symsagittifera roscoffensis TaxID=84072 RepID=UPI00307BE3C6
MVYQIRQCTSSKKRRLHFGIAKSSPFSILDSAYKIVYGRLHNLTLVVRFDIEYLLSSNSHPSQRNSQSSLRSNHLSCSPKKSTLIAQQASRVKTLPKARGQGNSRAAGSKHSPRGISECDLVVVIYMVNRLIEQLYGIENFLDAETKSLFETNVRLPLMFFFNYLRSKSCHH